MNSLTRLFRTIRTSTARKPDGSMGKDAVGAGILDAGGALSERAQGIEPPALSPVAAEQ